MVILSPIDILEHIFVCIGKFGLKLFGENSQFEIREIKSLLPTITEHGICPKREKRESFSKLSRSLRRLGKHDAISDLFNISKNSY